MAFGTVVHHFAIGVVGSTVLGSIGRAATVGLIGHIGNFGPHFFVIGFDGPRAGHVAQAPVKALIAAGGHVIQWRLCGMRHRV